MIMICSGLLFSFFRVFQPSLMGKVAALDPNEFQTRSPHE